MKRQILVYDGSDVGLHLGEQWIGTGCKMKDGTGLMVMVNRGDAEPGSWEKKNFGIQIRETDSLYWAKTAVNRAVIAILMFLRLKGIVDSSG